MASNKQKSAKMLGYGDEIKQWVSRVTAFSSQYNEDRWCAGNVIGSPKVYPEYGDIEGTWAMEDFDAHQFLELEFKEALFITGIDIYETYHAGGVKAILGKDPSGNWKTLWRTDRVQDLEDSRIFSPPLQDIGNRVSELRIEVDCTAAETWVEIDAVQMRGKKYRSEPPPSMDVLIKDIRKLVNDKQFSDVDFIVEGKTVYAHKNILAVRCDSFRSMFSSNTKETPKQEPKHDVPAVEDQPTNRLAKRQNPPKRANPTTPQAVHSPHQVSKQTIKIPDVSYRCFLGMMHYLYCNGVPSDFVGISLTELWRAADRYGVEGLKTYATFTVLNNLNASNVVDIYIDVSTKKPVIEDVQKTCMDYMISNKDEVVKSKNFSSLPKDAMVNILQATTAKLSL